jgi:hypothetical protein
MQAKMQIMSSKTSKDQLGLQLSCSVNNQTAAATAS